MADGYKIDPQALKKVEKGIDDALEELKEFGFDMNAQLGLGFSELELKGLEAGDAYLTDVFADFCDRWGWGVRGLMQEATDIARALNLNAGMYHEQEQYVSDTLKSVVTSAQGNPYLSEEEVQNRSWQETLDDNARSHVKSADYSAESVEQGISQGVEAWERTTGDIESSPLVAAPGYEDRVEWQWDGPPGAEAGGDGHGGNG